ncbi:glycerol acyltransferase [Flavobacteriaceae bacterium Ap0902]|nr:glycerol acyltransferase [Flavobacteriaceae bacterium Ap0902]
MKKFVGKLAFFLLGWKLDNKLDVSQIPSAVLVAGPHTSNWDFVMAIAAFWQMKIPIKVFIKDDWIKPWYGAVIEWFGGVGVNREQRQNLVEYAAELLRDQTQKLYFINTPEGTRSYADKWKRGFYYIALKGEVPILFAYADYAKKEAGIAGYIDPKEKSLEEVLAYAQDFYWHITPKYPEKYNKVVR